MTAPLLFPRHARARIAAPLPAATAAFARIGALWDCPVTGPETRPELTLPAGRVRLSGGAEAPQLSLDLDSAASLQTLRDALTEAFAAQGLGLHWADGRAGQPPANLARARVIAVTRLSPNFSRVRLAGADLARFATGGLHFRLLFGPPGSPWPTTDAQGVTLWPGGAAAWHRPVYTVRNLATRGAEPQLAFDLFRHPGGRVTAWADRVRPGTEVALTGPAGGTRPCAGLWQGFVGDETALPVIARMLAALPETTRGAAVLCLPEAADIPRLRHPPGVLLRWALRAAGDTPLSALAELHLPEGPRHVFFAAESTEASQARQTLSGRGLTRAEITAQGYWSRA